jgi:large subunit ribosomal protein L5
MKMDNKNYGTGMRKISIEKVVLNMGLGADGDVKIAQQILKNITKQKPVVTRTKKRTTFNVAKNKAIGCKVTVRKNKKKLIERLFQAKEKIIKESNFDGQGSLSIGIPEYITIPDVEYDPKIPILGLDVCIRLTRPGFCISKKGGKVGKKHRITKQEAIDFIRNNFDIKIEK